MCQNKCQEYPKLKNVWNWSEGEGVVKPTLSDILSFFNCDASPTRNPVTGTIQNGHKGVSKWLRKSGKGFTPLILHWQHWIGPLKNMQNSYSNFVWGNYVISGLEASLSVTSWSFWDFSSVYLANKFTLNRKLQHHSIKPEQVSTSWQPSALLDTEERWPSGRGYGEKYQCHLLLKIFTCFLAFRQAYRGMWGDISN